MVKRAHKYLFLRDQRWHYQRNVPKKFRHIEPRTRVRIALHTNSLQEALQRRDAMVEAENAYWTALTIEALELGGVSQSTSKVQEHHYKAATARALSFGYAYKTAQQLLTDTRVDDVMERVDVLAGQYEVGKEIPPKMEAKALLGGVSHPYSQELNISAVFQLYIDKIAFDAQLNKSPAQRKSWEKAKRTSVNYFTEEIGDIEIGDLNREHALNYRNWWANRIKLGDDSGERPTPYTANRHIGNMRTLYREYYTYCGQEDRPNPFRKLSFKEDRNSKSKRAPFETDWVRERFLVPGLFDTVNAEARHILLALIETGARPSEICNLTPDNIRLDVPVPYLAIRGKSNREVKADDSNRDIPLIGISLEAVKANPRGFPRYFDKETALSAILMKNLKARNLLPTKSHTVYSLRHSFEKRMLEANLDYGLRCKLMGHKNTRPEYGDGGSLEYRRTELMKITHPYPQGVV